MTSGIPLSPDHRPRRALGQNFLVDRGIQARIVEAVAPEPGETVLEIGPGKGALTSGLVALEVPLLLVELDRELAEGHRQQWADHAHVRVHEGDILDLPTSRMASLLADPEGDGDAVDPSRLVVVGNIPYNITTPILFHLLERPRPARILLMVQKEVADRLLAEPGTGGYGALSVGVRSVAEVERVLEVPSGAFRPRPRVASTVVRVTPRRPEPLTEAEERGLRTLTRALFQWRRKQLAKSLRDHPDLGVPRDRVEALLEPLGLDPRTRPEELSPARFLALSRALESLTFPGSTSGPSVAPGSSGSDAPPSGAAAH